MISLLNRKIKNILFICCISTTTFAQSSFPIDTTYTLKSVYIKVKKDHPEVSYVQSRSYKNVKQNKNIVYKKTNERSLHLDAYYDTNQKQNPAIVIIHGGGWRSGNRTQMETFAIEAASKGYSCFTIEFRLSMEAPYPAGIFDVKKAIQFIKKNAKEFHVDPNKIAVLGCSSGGQMAALIGTTNGKRKFEEANEDSKFTSAVNAIVDIDGTLAFKHPESIEGTVAGLWLGGSYEEIPEIWEEAAPLNQTDKNTPPILYINSSITRFHAGRDDMIAKLNQYGIYSEIKTFDNSPHSFWFLNPWFNNTVLYTTQFLDKIFNHKIN